MSDYWRICTEEILSDHDVNLDDKTIKSIADDIESCANVRSDYEPPISGASEIDELKKKIKQLEERRPCPKCGGKGGEWMTVGSSHSSWDDCHVCHGKKWV